MYMKVQLQKRNKTLLKKRNKVEDLLYQLESLIIKVVRYSLTQGEKNRIDQKIEPRNTL